MPRRSSKVLPLIRLLVAACAILFVAGSHAQLLITSKQLKPNKLIPIKALDSGVMGKMGVSVGDQVSENQILAKLDDEKYVYNLKVATLKVEHPTGVRSAQADVDERKAMLQDAQARLQLGQVTQQYVNSLTGRLETAQCALQTAQMLQKIAALDLDLAKNALERRYIRSPVNGVVVEISKPNHVKVNQGDSVITVADLNELTATVPMTPVLLEAFRSGKSVPITFGHDKATYTAMVIGVQPSPNKKGGQIAQLIFPSLLPTPFADAISVSPENSSTPPPQASVTPKSKS